MRLGVDRDSDAFFDFTEILQGSDPADPSDFTAKGTLPSASWIVLVLLALAVAVGGAGLLRRREQMKA